MAPCHQATEPPSVRWPFLPRHYDQWFFHSCAVNPDDRWPSVKEQIMMLEPILARAT